MPKCKSCGAPIEFIRLPSGKFTPVEVGKISIYSQEAGNWYLYKGHEPHWRNCPGAESHRRPRIKKGKVGPLTTRPG